MSKKSATRVLPIEGSRRLVLAAISALAACLLLFAARPVSAEDMFELRPLTRLKVTVVEWVPNAGEYREWAALNGEYVISQGGSISIPLVGEIAAAGHTARSLAALIANTLKQQTGLVNPPVATVEVVRYPSFYVTGSVDRPGEFEYRPGLTVLQAVAMAGGQARKTDPTGAYSELEQIRQAGELGQIELDLRRRLARRARLEAELEEKNKIVFPPEAGGAAPSGALAQIQREEEAIFKARTEAYARQLQSLQELAELFVEEIKTLDEKMVAQDRQIEITEAELNDVSKLVNSGTVVKSRETSLERILADLQSDKLDLVVASMRAKQRLSETERDVESLKGQHRTEIVHDLQIVDSEIEELKLKRDIGERLLQATGAIISRRGLQMMMEEQPLRFTIVRAGQDGGTFEASASTLIEPGDVLEVRVDLAEMAGGAPANAAAFSEIPSR